MASAFKKYAFLAAAAAFVVFLPSLTHGWTNYDDPMFLLGPTGWRGLGLANLRWAFLSNVGSVYQPLAWLSYGLDYSVWGMDARGYHLQSALWHAASAALMFFVARRVLWAVRPGPSKDVDSAALIAALVFALHPLRVESVSWASERRDVICCAFMLAAVLAHIRRAPAAAFGFFLLSLLAKGQALMLPVALFALDFAAWKRPTLKDKLPLFALSAVFGVIGMGAQERIRWTYEQHGLLARAMQACYALVFYIWKTVLPYGLMPLYELRPPMNPFEPRFVLSAALVAAGLTACWRLRKTRPWLAAAAFWYAVMLFPVTGLFQFGPQLVADRYSLLATLPFAVLAGAASMRRETAAKLVVLALAVLCVRQQRYWADSESLWARVLEGDPASATGQASLGVVRATQGRLSEARTLFQGALDSFPGCVEDQDRLAVLLARGDGDPEELVRLRQSVETHPVCRKARANIGAVLAQSGELAEAARVLEIAVLIAPDDEGARINLARARAALSLGKRP